MWFCSCAPYCVSIYRGALHWLGLRVVAGLRSIRVFGGSVGLSQDFCGPMAKQQRMAVLTGACLLAVIQVALGRSPTLLFWALAIVFVGSILTAIRRTIRIARILNQK